MGHNNSGRTVACSAKAPHCAYPMTRREDCFSRPANSRPATSGGFGTPAYPPWSVITSAKFNPPASTFTSILPVSALGAGTSCTSSASGPPNFVMTRAFMAKVYQPRWFPKLVPHFLFPPTRAGIYSRCKYCGTSSAGAPAGDGAIAHSHS
jgi:hypothetical protein